MSTIRVHFDGKVFVPDEPVNVPEGTPAQVIVIPQSEASKSATGRKPLAELAAILDAMPSESSLPPDFSTNLDHYLYGMPKRS
ncbi:MAG TPA: antitoxin family protein [Pirellulaceae bacterium]|nr:antitoxin family protein [Pirellulaceae bacterium]